MSPTTIRDLLGHTGLKRNGRANVMAEIHAVLKRLADKPSERITREEKEDRVHRTLRVTPAMQAKITDHIWSVRELLEAA